MFKNSDVGEVLKCPFGNYIIFYIIDDKLLKIVRVLNGARDFSDLF